MKPALRAALALLLIFSGVASAQTLTRRGAALSIMRGDISKTYHATAYTAGAANGGAAIQAALDAAAAAETYRCVYVSRQGPDTGGIWECSQAIQVPSNTTLIIDGWVKMASAAHDNILRNDSADSGNTTRDSNIHIRGSGTLDGNCGTYSSASNVVDVANFYKGLGVHFYKVDDFTISGLNFRNSAHWMFHLEDCTLGRVQDLRITQVTNGVTFSGGSNQDGIHIGGPAQDIVISNCIIASRDDAVAVDCRGGTVDASGNVTGRGTGGNVSNISINNIVSQAQATSAGIYRVFGFSGYTLQDVRATNLVGRGNRTQAIKIGWNSGGSAPIATEFKRVTIDGVQCDSTAALILIDTDFTDLTLANIRGNCGGRVIDCTTGLTTFDGLNVSGFRCSTSGTDVNGFYLRATNLGRVSVCDSWLTLTGSTTTYQAVSIANVTTVTGPIDIALTQTGWPKNFFINHTTTNLNGNRVNLAIRRTDAADAYDQSNPAPSTQPLMISGIGIESANAETPQSSRWRIGDLVNFTDSGDGSGNGLYIKLPGNTWTKLN